MKPKGAIGACALVLLLGAAACEGRSGREGRDPSTPSGFAVPRYVSLKFDKVYARSGPAEENRVLWTYTAKGLPVQIIAETEDWRRICDPNGAVAWVKKSQIDGRRSVMRNAPSPLALRPRPAETAEPSAYLRANAVAGLDRCEEGWCRIKAADGAGWAPASEVWGVDPEPQCRGGASSR